MRSQRATAAPLGFLGGKQWCADSLIGLLGGCELKMRDAGVEQGTWVRRLHSYWARSSGACAQARAASMRSPSRKLLQHSSRTLDREP